jgi:hypothetical protein
VWSTPRLSGFLAHSVYECDSSVVYMHHPGHICGGSSPKVASPDMSPEVTGSRESELESVLLVKETGVPGKTHHPAASH